MMVVRYSKQAQRKMLGLKAAWDHPMDDLHPSRECTVYHRVYTEDEAEAWILAIVRTLEAVYQEDVKIYTWDESRAVKC